MRAYLTGPTDGDFAGAARLLRAAGYAVQSVLDVPAEFSDDLRASLSWACDACMGADVVVVLPGYVESDAAQVDLTVADAIGTPVVDLDLALAREPEQLTA